MVVLSVKAFENLTAGTETKLDEADDAARRDSRRMTHHEVFSPLREKLND